MHSLKSNFIETVKSTSLCKQCVRGAK